MGKMGRPSGSSNPGPLGQGGCQGGAFKGHGMDLGFVDIWDKMSKDKKPCALARLDEILSGLSRRGGGVLGQAHLYLERG